MSKKSNKKYLARKSAQKALRASFLSQQAPSGKPADPVFSMDSAESQKPVEPKGMPGGRCNVTACQRENSAIFLNLGQIGGKHPDTGGCYYCVDCARDIHNANKRWSEQDKMTLFPMFDEMMARYSENFHNDKDPDDFENYRDINQNPWGSCHHFDRDKYLEKNEC